MSDLVQRLRKTAKMVMPHYPMDICTQAADRIEALEAALREIASDPDYGGHRAQVYKLIAQHALAPEQDK